MIQFHLEIYHINQMLSSVFYKNNQTFDTLIRNTLDECETSRGYHTKLLE